MLAVLVLVLVGAEENYKKVFEKLSVSATSLTFTTYTAGRTGHHTNAHILVGNEAAVLIDTEASPGDTKKLIAAAQATGKPVQTVLLTSPDADQIAGVELVREAFPAARFVTTADVLRQMKQPKILAATEIVLGEHRLPIVAVSYGKDKPCAALDVAPLQVLVGGCTFNGEHTFQGGEKELAKRALDALQKLGSKTLLVTYGSSGDSTALLTAMRRNFD